MCEPDNPLSVAHVYMCLGLTTWDRLTYQGLVPEAD